MAEASPSLEDPQAATDDGSDAGIEGEQPSGLEAGVDGASSGQEGGYLEQETAKWQEAGSLGGLTLPAFDFSGTPSEPTAARGRAGLNEQGYEPYDPSAATSPSDDDNAPAYLIGLGAAGLLTIILTFSNMAGSQ